MKWQVDEMATSGNGNIMNWWSGNSSKQQLMKRQLIESWWDGNSSNALKGRQLIELFTLELCYFWWVAAPVATHQIPLRGGNSWNPLKGRQLIKNIIFELISCIKVHLVKGSFVPAQLIEIWKSSTAILSWPNLTFGQASPSLSELGRSLLASYPDLT